MLSDLAPLRSTNLSIQTASHHHLHELLSRRQFTFAISSCCVTQVVHDEVVLSDIIRSARMPDVAYSFVRAGPRPDIRIHPKDVKAAIVTCGGLCPGLNDTVQEIFNCLWCEFGATTGG